MTPSSKDIRSIVRFIKYVRANWKHYHDNCEDCALTNAFEQAGWKIDKDGSFKITAMVGHLVVKWGNTNNDRALYRRMKLHGLGHMLPRVYYWGHRVMIQQRLDCTAYHFYRKSEDGYRIVDKYIDELRKVCSVVGDVLDNEGNYGLLNGRLKVIDGIVRGLHWDDPDRVCGRFEDGQYECIKTQTAKEEQKCGC